MIEEIRPDFFRLEIPLPNSPLRFLNSYVIRSPHRNLIIDTGFDRKECYEAMCSGLQQLQIDMTLTDFFITHLHVDHFGLLPDLVTGSSNIFFNRPEKELIKTGDRWDRRIAFAIGERFSRRRTTRLRLHHIRATNSTSSGYLKRRP